MGIQQDTGLLMTSHSQTVTTFLVTNLHCPSCVSNIESSLSALDPKPLSISISIVSHSVAVRHTLMLSIHDISHVLTEIGFEIYSVSRCDEDDTLPRDELLEGTCTDELDDSFEKAIQGWRLNGRNANIQTDEIRQRHAERCPLCREESKLLDKPRSVGGDSAPMEDKQNMDATMETMDKPFVVIDTSPTQLFQASLAIDGMTCSTCTGKITSVMKDIPWVRSANVTLLNNGASVVLEGKDHLQDLVRAVEDAGYDAIVQSVEELPENTGQRGITETWQASYAIGGMTCSSCAADIKLALQHHGWIISVSINRVANTGQVVFKGREHLEDIPKIIEAAGFEATLDEVRGLGENHDQDLHRKIAIRVDGMYCDHCPPRIERSLATEFGLKVSIDKPLSWKDPIFTVTYIPESPRLTLRHILSCISATDPAFNAFIHHLPTLEERSRRMLARDQWRILFRVILSITVAIPTFIVGIVYMELVSSDNPVRQFLMQPIWAGTVSRSEWAVFIMATPVYWFAADVFHVRALKELRALWRPGSKVPFLRRFYRFGSMNMLLSFGTSIAYFASIAQLAIAAARPSTASMEPISLYFDAVVFLTMFLLIGRWLEAYSKSKSGDAVTMLGKLRPSEAILVTFPQLCEGSKDVQTASQLQKIDVDLLELGDIVKVLPGSSPPSDGIVVEGKSMFDESSLTGESKLVVKSVNDEVFSGTVNMDSPVSVRVTHVQGNSMLDQIVKVVREGQTRRAPIERLADIITSYFVPIITLIAVLTWIVWLALGLSGALPADYLNVGSGGWPFWSLQFAIAVFVVACPCGIGLAAPTALFVGSGLAAHHGILVKGGGEAFQEASDLDCIVFDKTGTLTQGGEPLITDHVILSPVNARLIYGILKRLEESSSHPIAKALVSFCGSQDLEEVLPNQVQEIPGRGMRGTCSIGQDENQVEVVVGNEEFMHDYGIGVEANNAEILNRWKSQQKSVALVGIRSLNVSSENTHMAFSNSWTLSAIFAVSDPVRPEASAVINAIQRRGIQVWMLSGDNPTTALMVGRTLGIPRRNIIAGIMPDQKAEKIQHLQKTVAMKRSKFSNRFSVKKRATVAMVGDGVNDSPALAMADVGIAIGSGSDIAISCAEFVLISSSLRSLLTLIDLSRIVFRRVKFNFGWALIYNLIALPLAAGVLYPVKSNGGHIELQPVWASLAMALSSISVVCSSLLLRSGLPLVGFKPTSTLD